MSNKIAVRVHPPTAGAGVICMDGGGTRGIVPLIHMKRNQDRIDLPIPLSRFVKVVFGGLLLIAKFFDLPSLST
ncbi:hypothetical protein GQ44DRAFT_775069 [Phaeosphaeriaceae sp. PMI808]|nr:hypothetical protein GQ44DRAFT_775069 [Phaeosphaeriaceae sp. PMI808]